MARSTRHPLLSAATSNSSAALDASPIFFRSGRKSLTPGVIEDQPTPSLQRWFEQSSLAFGARAGIVHSLNHSGPDEPTTIPIDERFFNGGATTVRSFGERDLGPHDPKGNPIGGEFFTVFNVEYTFPIYGELQGAVFFDAGDLLPTSEELGVDDMRYALGLGLRCRCRSVRSGSITDLIPTGNRAKTSARSISVSVSHFDWHRGKARGAHAPRVLARRLGVAFFSQRGRGLSASAEDGADLPACSSLTHEDRQDNLGDIPPDVFRDQLHELADWIADYREKIGERRIARTRNRARFWRSWILRRRKRLRHSTKFSPRSIA